MNILFLASTLPRFRDDQQAPFVLEQAQAWKTRRPNDQVTILAPHDAKAARQEKIGGVTIYRFRYFAPSQMQALAYPAILPNLKRNPLLAVQILPFLVAEYAVARRIVQKDCIDLIYAHWVMPQGVVAWWLKRTTGVPYIIQSHSSDLALFYKAGKIGRVAARAIISGAHKMFCVNYHQKDGALGLFPVSTRSNAGEGITVLPMGVGLDVDAVRSIKAASSHRYALTTISRLSRKKGIDLLIAAADQLAENGQKISIAIAGDGEDRDALTAMPQRADITFLGFLSGRDKIRFFNDTCFMAFPSVAAGMDVEGLPVALLEALCCGRVVIAGVQTNLALLDEWKLISQDVILLDDPRNIGEFARAIGQLLALDQMTLAARSEHLRKIMARYRWENLIDEYLAAINVDQIVDQRRSRERKSATSSTY